MTAAERKGELVKREIKHRDIAEKLGVDRSLVTHVIGGRKRNERIERAIAKAIRVPVAVAFPEVAA